MIRPNTLQKQQLETAAWPGSHDQTEPQFERFVTTRYQGSKRKLLGILSDVFSNLSFNTVLDPFCGSCAVSYLLKCLGKKVTSSDILHANIVTAKALICNQNTRLQDDLISIVCNLPQRGMPPGFIERTFEGIFFESHENRFIDQVLIKIDQLPETKRCLALYCLFQAALSKRPYNLFHRANLYMRQNQVKRSFGNKVTWDKPFDQHMIEFARGVDNAIFDSGSPCEAFQCDVLEIDPNGYDLVYLDPPYVSAKGTGVDYLDFYHFLEGLCTPSTWESRILTNYKHKPLKGKGQNPWADKQEIQAVFEATINHYKNAIQVISYRSDGIPAIDQIAQWLKNIGKIVNIIDVGQYTYALSQNRKSKEVIIVGQ